MSACLILTTCNASVFNGLCTSHDRTRCGLSGLELFRSRRGGYHGHTHVSKFDRRNATDQLFVSISCLSICALHPKFISKSLLLRCSRLCYHYTIDAFDSKLFERMEIYDD